MHLLSKGSETRVSLTCNRANTEKAVLGDARLGGGPPKKSSTADQVVYLARYNLGGTYLSSKFRMSVAGAKGFSPGTTTMVMIMIHNELFLLFPTSVAGSSP